MDKNILAIYGSHDASATFVDKNNQLRVLELERFSDIRFSMYSSQFDNLNFARHLAINENIRREFISYIKGELKETPDIIICQQMNNEDLTLLREYFPNSEFEYFDGHHLSHAYGSYLQSPFDDALVFTVDGGGSDMGMHTTTKVYLANGNEIKEIHKPKKDYGFSYSSIGGPISEISPGGDGKDIGVFLTYAGKIMGLCAYGKVVPEWVLPMEKYYDHMSIEQLGKDIGLSLTLNSLSGENSFNLAATSQYVFENLLLEFVLEFFNKYKKNIVLTGGCALNVLFNQKLKTILNEKGFDLYVPPNPNDCGQSLGQYLFKTRKHIEPLVYSGFDILDRNDLNTYLDNDSYISEKASPEKIVELISAGKIGGIIQGYSEVGPRALGNRSIICDPSFKDMKDVLNEKVKFREWFRPFAPVCREEDMHTYFEDAFPSHYMSYAPLVKTEYRDKLPSVTHNDGTSRLQTVTEDQHKLFYDILTCMQNVGKIPVILNTSFNIKGRPILTRIKDAFHVLDNTKLDFLVVEGNLVFKNSNKEKFYNNENTFNYIRYNSLPALADHIIDHPPSYYEGWGVTCLHHKKVGLGEVKKYDTIFVNADLLDNALTMLEEITVPFHLLTGNADKIVNRNTIDRIFKTKIVSWSGHNFPKINDRCLQIPMGFAEIGPKRPNSFVDYIELHENKLIPLVVTPFGATHTSRSDLNNLYGEGILNLKDSIDYSSFLTLLSISKYSCCPRGNALDSHRFVESIACNSIPIVITSDLDPLYHEMGAVIITDWNECKDIKSLPIPKLNRDVVTLEYWQERIRTHQKQFERLV